MIFPGPPLDWIPKILASINSVGFRGVNFGFFLPGFDFFRTQYDAGDWECVDEALLELNARVGGVLEVGVRVECPGELPKDNLLPFVREFLPRVYKSRVVQLVMEIGEAAIERRSSRNTCKYRIMIGPGEGCPE